MGILYAVVGGQFGSESKGNVAAWLAEKHRDEHAHGRTGLAVVRCGGPNAGHTAYDPDGRAWAMRQVPVAAVTHPECVLIIAAGSEIDEPVLEAEVKALDDAGFDASGRLLIDSQATIITDEHKKRETGLVGRVGSTGKGIGAARAARLMREAPVYGGQRDEDVWSIGLDTAAWMKTWMENGNDVLIEGTQGYGLGLHAGYYPTCTSSDARAIDFMSMAGISPWAPWVERVEPWVVLRTYPIRVAGNSGPMHGELEWDELADRTDGYIKPEKTTVTKKVRRIGEWDLELAQNAIRENGGESVRVALGFLDYLWPEIADSEDPGALTEEMWEYIEKTEQDLGARIAYVGTGKDSRIDLRGRWRP